MQSELKFSDLADTTAEPAMLPPSADLWQRIATAHVARKRRRATRRIAGIGSAAVLVIAVVTAGVVKWREPSAVDWQARAQALEMQLNEALAQRDLPLTGDTEEELERVDLALQAAYDHGADKTELVPLWKQRSELLSLLLSSRQQQLA